MKGTPVPELAQLLPILVFALVLWLMLIRPAQKRRNQVLAMQSALKVGDRIELTSGIHGDIIELTDDEARLEIAPGTVIT
ncbi:MAG: preprotein translocase subunit YajC, partial [Nocardioides sp.]